ncbi:MAG: DUF1836 domain-containing protein [Oscillospiraceae bacterium]|nr:DUF1836 domain-containing protein [Oscillospiraceae bacterium]
MVDNQVKPLPESMSSQSTYGERSFAKIAMLLEATGGLSLSQVCAVTGLEGSTIQNWVKRGWVAHPKGKKYEDVHVARILIINALKDCIKLEHIALLMSYVNGSDDGKKAIIKESKLYDYLSQALQRLGQADDLSQSGVEAVVETVIADFDHDDLYGRFRIRKALAVMIYACVCTDVKRRTETMMEQVINELENPDSISESDLILESSSAINISDVTLCNVISEPSKEKAVQEDSQATAADENRKTIAQALREWDLAQNEENEQVDDSKDEDESEKEESMPVIASEKEDEAEKQDGDETQTQPQRPLYFRRD